VQDERRIDLRRTYLRLGTGELAAAAIFAVVAAGSVAPRLGTPSDRAALWSALAPLLAVLVQAGGYWLAARTWVGETAMPSPLARTYLAFRAVDPVLLGAGLVGVLAWWPERPGVAALVVVVWAFGAVEYLNYFVVRLAYPPARWAGEVTRWRTPRLVRDAVEGAARPSDRPEG
jgi:hypothetical protein